MTSCNSAESLPVTTTTEPSSQIATEAMPSQRLLGLDVARSLAIAGMIVIHFCVTMGGALSKPSSLIGISDHLVSWFQSEIDGRPAALFMILAGIGVTLMTRRAVLSGDPAAIATKRRVLVFRGVILLIMGYLNLIIWIGDILRVYGVSMFVATALITASNRTLWLVTLGFVGGFIVMFLSLDYSEHWDWDSMAYDNQWSPSGIVRHLFYDGFRSVLPWTGLMCFGMWLGRLNFSAKLVNTPLWAISISILFFVRGISGILVGFLVWLSIGLDYESVNAIFGTDSMPPLPLFLLSTCSSAVFVIALCVRFVGERPNLLVQALADTGQMALTWYVLHIVVGLGTIEYLGLIGSSSHTMAAICGLAFFALAVITSYFWKRCFPQGPLEYAMRKLGG